MAARPESKVTVEIALEHGLAADEYQKILTILGRDPTWTELGIFSVMWSEHCSYKSSRIHLGKLPTTGPKVIQGPGENAGVVDIGDGQALVFKMESHNHPSFIEPYQGAATGVGGILRDVFTMGARPIACLNSLRFGRPDHPRTAQLVEGVVAGIAGYGNAFGVPTVGGEVYFDSSYDGNILVNAMAVGLCRADRIFLGKAEGLGNPVLYFGAKTGRDGIHGATMASAEFDETSESKRPTVQVGDPFTEKLLLEACLELMQEDILVGIQDMGAAGLTSSSVEMAARAGNGIELNLDAVPCRETHMTAYEMMLSESQERMLAVVKKGEEQRAMQIFQKWDLDAAVVGRVTDTGKICVIWKGKTVAEIPVDPLAAGIKLERPVARAADFEDRWTITPVAKADDYTGALTTLLGSPNIASKGWIFHQYDHMVGAATALAPGQGDAAVVRILAGSADAESAKGIAATTDCNSRFCWLDPYEGARLTVAEAYRNLSCVGAEPIAITDCLNFGSPERPEVMWQFQEAIRGLGDACRALGTPVVSGNVSFYNETDGRSIKPTPSVGMVGTIRHARDAAPSGFAHDGDIIALIGENTDELGGSEYLFAKLGEFCGRPPAWHPEREIAVGTLCRQLIAARLLASAHDCSEGGLAVALAESALVGPSGRGVDVDLADELAADALLFGEAPSRIVISFTSDAAAQVEKLAAQSGVRFAVIGRVTGDKIVVRQSGKALVSLDVKSAKQAYWGGLERVVA